MVNTFTVPVLSFILFLLVDTISTKRAPFRTPQISKKSIFKNILLWCPPKTDCHPFKEFRSGNEVFNQHSCEYKKCTIVPMNVKPPYIKPEHYDAVLFNGAPEQEGRGDEPALKTLRRSWDQMYIFVQLQPADRLPVTEEYYDTFFNWTMTYRLDSDIPWPHFEVRTLENEIVAPSDNVQWFQKDMPVSWKLMSKLKNKTKLAAWVTDCKCKMFSGRNNFVENLQVEIRRLNYTQSIDIYGDCGPWDCPQKRVTESCNPLINKDYMFFLVMEEAISEDYLSDKVLRAVQNNAVPVVYSGANLKKFLPHGSYLDARALGARALAQEMNRLFTHRRHILPFFNWRTSYVVQANREPRPACELCQRLHTHRGTTTNMKFLKWSNRNQWHQDTINPGVDKNYC